MEDQHLGGPGGYDRDFFFISSELIRRWIDCPDDDPATEDVPALAETIASEVSVQEPPSHTAAAAAESKPIRASQGGLDDDGQNCTICFQPWTSSSEHRLVSLRCGHLFGRSCISRWLKGQNARCPQCNSRAREVEIRNIYAKSLKVLDTSERDKALEDLAKEVTARRNAEIKHGLAVQECERLKKELMDAQKQLQEYRRLRRSQAAVNIKAGFSPEHSMNMSKDGGSMLLVTQPSPKLLFQNIQLEDQAVMIEGFPLFPGSRFIYGINELPQEAPADIGRKLLYCENCGVKHAAIIVTFCFECGAPRFL